MDGRDAELLSDSLYEATGLDPEVEPGALRLLVRLPFIQLDFIEDLAPRSALIVRHGSYVVCVRESLALRDVEWACGHELAHAFGNTVHGGADYDRVERRCNRIAAALIAPRAAMVVLRDAYGYDLARFGAALRMHEITVAKRWVEVFGPATAVELEHAKTLKSSVVESSALAAAG